jgi:LytS/YehU family sensor histidine kinase
MLVDRKFVRQQMPFPPKHEHMEGKFPPRPQGSEIDMPPFDGKKMDKPRPRPPFFGFGLIAISILIVGFNSGTKIFVRWTEEKNTQSEKEKQHLITELAYLKNQISPHFFMNTLNNIHALVDIDGEKAKEAIIKLSRLMRYLLYESEDGQVALSKEINFLESYIELMRLRYSESTLSVKMEYPANLDSVQVPPFLFLSFVENAFKYGVNPRGVSAINIQFAIDENHLFFNINNQIFTKNETELKESSGIGLENIKKRLQLIYPNNYTLSISTQNNLHVVELTMPKTT